MQGDARAAVSVAGDGDTVGNDSAAGNGAVPLPVGCPAVHDDENARTELGLSASAVTPA